VVELSGDIPRSVYLANGGREGSRSSGEVSDDLSFTRVSWAASFFFANAI